MILFTITQFGAHCIRMHVCLVLLDRFVPNRSSSSSTLSFNLNGWHIRGRRNLWETSRLYGPNFQDLKLFTGSGSSAVTHPATSWCATSTQTGYTLTSSCGNLRRRSARGMHAQSPPVGCLSMLCFVLVSEVRAGHGSYRPSLVIFMQFMLMSLIT